MEFERALPSDMRINSFIEEARTEMAAEIDDVREKNALRDLLDIDIEFSNTGNLESFLAIAEYLDVRLLSDGDDPDPEQQAAIYRAAVFAYQTMRVIHGVGVEIGVGEYLEHLDTMESTEALDAMVREVYTYLGDNRVLFDYIDWYMDELSPDADCQNMARAAAGMVFMLGERYLGKRFVSEEMRGLTPESVIGGDQAS